MQNYCDEKLRIRPYPKRKKKVKDAPYICLKVKEGHFFCAFNSKNRNENDKR